LRLWIIARVGVVLFGLCGSQLHADCHSSLGDSENV
jgi:hypothetical protein